MIIHPHKTYAGLAYLHAHFSSFLFHFHAWPPHRSVWFWNSDQVVPVWAVGFLTHAWVGIDFWQGPCVQAGESSTVPRSCFVHQDNGAQTRISKGSQTEWSHVALSLPVWIAAVCPRDGSQYLQTLRITAPLNLHMWTTLWLAEYCPLLFLNGLNCTEAEFANSISACCTTATLSVVARINILQTDHHNGTPTWWCMNQLQQTCHYPRVNARRISRNKLPFHLSDPVQIQPK